MGRRRRRRGRTKQIIFLILSIEVLVIIGGLAYFQLRPEVVKVLTVEAGDQEITAERFLKYQYQEGRFITDIESINTSIPGSYEVQIMVGSRVHTSLLEVVDTISPAVTVADQLALCGEVPDAKVFVTEVSDATQVSMFFEEEPDTSVPGEQEVTIICEDSGGNRTVKKAQLTVLDVRSTVTMEAGSPMNITPADFLNNSNYDVTFLTDLRTLDTSKPVTHPIELLVNGKLVTGNIEVVDTTPPKVTARKQQVWRGQEAEAIIFLDSIEDASEVTASYKTAPDFNSLGDQEITLLVKDSSGNTTELPAMMTVAEDTEPPVILGAADKIIYLGDSVSYKKGVSVSDNKDKDLPFEVDASKVNLKKEGTYTVTYAAEDTSGNKAVKKITIRVKKIVISQDTVNELCDEVLGKISKSSMTKREVAYEIYKWIKQHVNYSGDSDKTDWLAEAYRGMTVGSGDCFTYFAVAQALLTRAGIDNMEVTRVGGRTRHYWNLINCGDGWYHFDSCPNRDHLESFMLTDKQTEEYTKKRGNNYYVFDKSLYPATPEE